MNGGMNGSQESAHYGFGTCDTLVTEHLLGKSLEKNTLTWAFIAYVVHY